MVSANISRAAPLSSGAQTLLGVVKTFYGHQCGDIHGMKILRLFFDQGQDFARQAPFGGDITHANIGAARHNFDCLNRRHGSTIFIGNQQRIEKVGITASDTRSGRGETAGDHQLMRRAGNRRGTDDRTHTDHRRANLFERRANSWNRENRADAGDRVARTNDDRLRRDQWRRAHPAPAGLVPRRRNGLKSLRAPNAP